MSYLTHKLIWIHSVFLLTPQCVMPDMELENSSMVTYGVNASHVCREALKVARVI